VPPLLDQFRILVRRCRPLPDEGVELTLEVHRRQPQAGNSDAAPEQARPAAEPRREVRR
jgi:hypothetical protein